MRRNSRRAAHLVGHQFSSTRQPKVRRSRLKVARNGVYDAREVARLAEDSVEASDIASVLGLVVRLQGDEVLRKRFEVDVAAGHARWRATLAAQTAKEVRAGKTTPMTAAQQGWLPERYGEALAPEVEVGIAERLLALIDDVVEHRRRMAPDAS